MPKKTQAVSDEQQAVENLQVIIEARSLKKGNSDRMTLRNWQTRLGTARETTTASDHARLTALLLDAIDALLGHEAKAEDCATLFKALRSSPALIRRLIDIQTGEHTAQLKTYLRMSTDPLKPKAPTSKEPEMPQREVTRPHRDRSGFVASTRRKKVSLQTFVDEETHQEVSRLAGIARLSTKDFLAQLIENAVGHGINRSVKTEITKNTRQAEAARDYVLSHVLQSPLKKPAP